MTAQIHVLRQGQVQTLAAQPTSSGVWLLSTFAATGNTDDSEVHIPAKAGAWLASVAGTMIKPALIRRPDTLANRLRAIAANPGLPAIVELLRIAAQVARMELTLDEMVADAAEDARA